MLIPINADAVPDSCVPTALIASAPPTVPMPLQNAMVKNNATSAGMGNCVHAHKTVSNAHKIAAIRPPRNNVIALIRRARREKIDLKNLLADFPVEEWCAPVSGPEQGFRNKAKMVVSGSVEKPLLGMLHRDGTPEDLCDCPLYPASFAPVFAALKPFIARAGLTPYNVARKRGELKYILLTESQSDGGMMLRFVLRSDTKLTQLRKALPWLQEQLPQLKVITVNIQPVHMAIMEGETEIDPDGISQNTTGRARSGRH